MAATPLQGPTSDRSNPVLHIVLYQPEIPQNTGNIGRTCVAMNAKLWIVRPMGFRLDSAHVQRSGLDYWSDLNLEIVDSWQDLVAKIPTQRLWFFSKFATKNYTQVAFERGDALVFGSESNGLPESLRTQNQSSLLGIPMPGPVRSLNLSVCVGIAAYEAFRQIHL
jgi:tRNA (cytidine/uridine-2'-O-)-methyltransferase